VDEEKATPLETEEDVLIVCDMLADWVDGVSNEVLEEYANQVFELAGSEYGGLEEEFWETVSEGSQDCNDEEVLDLVPEARETLQKVEPQEALQAPSPLMASPLASPSSRSSTPSRQRRRVIGRIVRTASPACGTPFQRPTGLDAVEPHIMKPKAPVGLSPVTSKMRRAVSMSALAMDLGIAHNHVSKGRNVVGGTSALDTNWRCDAGRVEFPTSSGFERRCVKSKSLGLLPALSGHEGSKAALISWSVNMSKTKPRGLRLVF